MHLSHEAASLIASTPQTSASGSAEQPAPQQVSVETEVLGNILRQPIGKESVASLGLPEPFLWRVADRIIRKSYVDRYRIVVADAAPEAHATSSENARGGVEPTGVETSAKLSAAWIAVMAVALVCAFAWVLWKKRAGAR